MLITDKRRQIKMIIDSKQYNGKCKCGKTHEMTTEFCVVEKNCMEKANEYMNRYGLNGFCTAIYDENTYKVTKDVHPNADKEVILPPENLHADNHGVKIALEQIPKETKYLIAVGSGTIHDITRYCAYKLGVHFVSCPTAASVDGFCSSVAAMTWDGFKKTFTAVAPKIVIADMEIVSKAPFNLTKSGFGDMIGKYIALSEWKIGHILTDEYICKEIYDMTMDATKEVMNSADGIKNGDLKAYEKLMYGLLMSGIAMQLLGYSRCASGAEHHISHFIEMQPTGANICSNALHGEKVGVGTLLASKEYHRIRNIENISFKNYPQIDDDYIIDMYGKDLCGSILEENKNNCAKDITAELMKGKWSEICKVIDEIPTYEEFSEKYKLLGLKSTLEDIEVPNKAENMLLEYSPFVRNRLTLMRLRKCINL